LAQRQEVHQLEAMTLRVIALDDLIRIKEHLRRWKDRDSLVQLLAIRQLRQEPPKE
jgi:hypothetical protein